MEWNDISFGLVVVSLAMLCVSQGYQFMSQTRCLKLQAEMLKAQAELAAIYAEMKTAREVGVFPVAGWRELPPEARTQLRSALVAVLAEMDADGAVRH